MTIMGNNQQCRHLESLMQDIQAPQGEVGSGPLEHLLCFQSLLQGSSLPSGQADPQELLPSGLGQAFRGPQALSNSCQVTKGTCSVPTIPPAWYYSLLCFDCEIPPSLGMNQFSHSVATLGFCHLSVPKEFSVGLGWSQTWHEGRGAAQEWGLDRAAIPA